MIARLHDSQGFKRQLRKSIKTLHQPRARVGCSKRRRGEVASQEDEEEEEAEAEGDMKASVAKRDRNDR